MKISASNFNNVDTRISMSAETEAEKYQLKALMEQMDKAGTKYQEWDNMEGQSGICIITKRRIT